MLVRTNIYLHQETVNFLKQKAEEERVAMAKIIRNFLEKEMEKENKNWASSLLELAKKAKGSKIGDLSKKHDHYLYQLPQS